MGWTKQQEKAIYTSGHNIIVSAGAGSGKTAVLSERVLEFVKNHSYRIDQFLILTFTNLAAGEMKHRIRKKLKDQTSKTAFVGGRFGSCFGTNICSRNFISKNLLSKSIKTFLKGIDTLRLVWYN